MLCIIVQSRNKHVVVIQETVIHSRRLKEWAIIHWKRQDMEGLSLLVEKFVFVDANGEIEEIILAEDLKAPDVDYESARRSMKELTREEIAEVLNAIEIVRDRAKFRAEFKAYLTDVVIPAIEFVDRLTDVHPDAEPDDAPQKP